MENAPQTSSIPPSIDRVLKLFRSMGREEKMQSLVQYSKKLEPLPERFKDIDRANFTVPECQTREIGRASCRERVEKTEVAAADKKESSNGASTRQGARE